MRFFQKSRAYVDVDVDEQVSESTPDVTGQDDADMYYEIMGLKNNNSVPNQHVFPRYSSEEECANANSKSEKDTANQNNEYPKNKPQSIGELVRKLNCSASKKHDCDERTRPVLITVTGEETTNNLITVSDSSSPSRLGSSARKRQYSPRDKDRSRRCGGWPLPNHQNTIRTPQEVARKERWKRGFEMEKRMFKNKNTRGRARDDLSSMGSYTTVTTGTGYTSTEDDSSNTDWTDATEESYYHQQHGQNSSGGHCTSGQIAEDFSIFADLLLSDGYACFGTAAAITTETVGECRGNNA